MTNSNTTAPQGDQAVKLVEWSLARDFAHQAFGHLYERIAGPHTHATLTKVQLALTALEAEGGKFIESTRPDGTIIFKRDALDDRLESLDIGQELADHLRQDHKAHVSSHTRHVATPGASYVNDAATTKGSGFSAGKE